MTIKDEIEAYIKKYEKREGKTPCVRQVLAHIKFESERLIIVYFDYLIRGQGQKMMLDYLEANRDLAILEGDEKV